MYHEVCTAQSRFRFQGERTVFPTAANAIPKAKQNSKQTKQKLTDPLGKKLTSAQNRTEFSFPRIKESWLANSRLIVQGADTERPR